MSLFSAATSTGADAADSAAPAKTSSTAALAVATGFRRIDARLTKEEIATIARGIDDNTKAAAALNPKKKRLRNSDEPATIFSVSE